MIEYNCVLFVVCTVVMFCIASLGVILVASRMFSVRY